jgi:hypothetical protein
MGIFFARSYGIEIFNPLLFHGFTSVLNLLQNREVELGGISRVKSDEL